MNRDAADRTGLTLRAKPAPGDGFTIIGDLVHERGHLRRDASSGVVHAVGTDGSGPVLVNSSQELLEQFLARITRLDADLQEISPDPAPLTLTKSERDERLALLSVGLVRPPADYRERAARQRDFARRLRKEIRDLKAADPSAMRSGGWWREVVDQMLDELP